MISLRTDRLVPLLGLCALLVLSIVRLTTAVEPRDSSEPARALAAELGYLLATGHTQGYGLVLQDQQPARSLDIEVLNRHGLVVARWPEPWTAQSWGPFASLLQGARDGLVSLVSEQRVQEIFYQDTAVGELNYRVWGGVAGVRAQVLVDGLLAVLALWGLLVWSRSKPTSEPPDNRPSLRRRAATVERLGLRLGPALNQSGLGVITLDRSQKLRYINRSAADLLGWSCSDALNMPIYSVIRIANEEQEPSGVVSNPFAMGPHDPQSQDLDLSLDTRDNRRVRLQVHALRLRRANDEPGGMLLLLKSAEQDFAEREVLQLEADLARKTLDFLGDGLVITDKYGRIKRVNQRLRRLFAYADDDLDGVAISKLLPVPFLNEPTITLRNYVGSRVSGLPRVVGWRKDATTFPVELQVQELHDETYAFLLLIKDCGEVQRQGNLAMRLGRLLDYAAEEIYIFDAHSLYITEINREARENMGYSQDQLSRMTPLHLAPGLDRQQLEADLSSLRHGEQRQVAYRTEHRRADGSRYPVSVRISFSREEEPPVFMALAQDITEQCATEARLEYLAHNDSLTGLPNRSVMTESLDQLLEGQRGPIVLFFCDLDRFKSVNDQYGHLVGDAVLKEFARRLKTQLPKQYLAARLSGDEFAVIGHASEPFEAESLAQDVLDAMSATFVCDGVEIEIRVSIGVAYAQLGEAATNVLRRADSAMYTAKSKGGQSYYVAPEPGDAVQAMLA